MLIEILIILLSISFSVFISAFLTCGIGLHYWLPFVLLIPGYIVGLIVMWIILSLFALPFNKNKFYDKPSKWALFWLQEALKYIKFHAHIKLNIEGNMPLGNEKFLLVCNHRSKFDPMILSALYGYKYSLAFISKPTNFKIPIGGRLMAGSSYLAIDRYDKLKSLNTMGDAAQLINKNYASVGVFPEGTRSDNNQMGPFHEGVFNIAKKANCPIVITSFMGTEKIKDNFPFKKSCVTLKIIEVLYPNDYQDKIAKEISDYCFQKMDESLTDK